MIQAVAVIIYDADRHRYIDEVIWLDSKTEKLDDATKNSLKPGYTAELTVVEADEGTEKNQTSLSGWDILYVIDMYIAPSDEFDGETYTMDDDELEVDQLFKEEARVLPRGTVRDLYGHLVEKDRFSQAERLLKENDEFGKPEVSREMIEIVASSLKYGGVMLRWLAGAYQAGFHSALGLAINAHHRHANTRYEELLEKGFSRREAWDAIQCDN